MKDQNDNRNDPEDCSLGKILEKVIVPKYQELRSAANWKFGFKGHRGCDMTAFVVRVTISHFLENGNNVLSDRHFFANTSSLGTSQ